MNPGPPQYEADNIPMCYRASIPLHNLLIFSVILMKSSVEVLVQAERLIGSQARIPFILLSFICLSLKLINVLSSQTRLPFPI